MWHVSMGSQSVLFLGALFIFPAELVGPLPAHKPSDSPSLLLVLGFGVGGFRFIFDPTWHAVLLCCYCVHVP